MAKTQTIEEWWAEDADDYNWAGDYFEQNGIGVDTGAGPPPPLNPDGSLAEPQGGNNLEPLPPPVGGTTPGGT